MFTSHSTATPSTLVSHAADALMYGQWSEATRLFDRAADRMLETMDQCPRLTLLSACVGLEPSPAAFKMLATLVDGSHPLYLFGQIISPVSELSESEGKPAAHIRFVDEEIDTTLSELGL